MRRRRFRPIVLAAAACVSLSVNALAAPDAAIPVRIAFDAPPDCPTRERFVAGIRGRNSRVRLAASDEAAFEVRVRVTRVGAVVHGELQLSANSGEPDTRGVDGATCELVVDALALTTALALDVAAEERRNESGANPGAQTPAQTSESRGPPPAGNTASPAGNTPPDSTEAAPKPDAARVSENAPARDEAADVRARFAIAGHAHLARVIDPYWNLGANLEARLLLERGNGFSPMFAVSVTTTRSGLVGTGSDADVEWSAIGISGCPWRGEIVTVVVTPCLLASGGAVTATGDGYSIEETATRSWWSAGAKLRGAVPLSRILSLELELGVVRPLVERRFVVAPTERAVGQTPELSVFGGIGLATWL